VCVCVNCVSARTWMRERRSGMAAREGCLSHRRLKRAAAGRWVTGLLLSQPTYVSPLTSHVLRAPSSLFPPPSCLIHLPHASSLISLRLPGLTAVDLCKNAGRVDVVKFLLARGGQTRLVLDAHRERAAQRREALMALHRDLPAAMRQLMRMMQVCACGCVCFCFVCCLFVCLCVCIVCYVWACLRVNARARFVCGL
jgi:hypothetical protein